MVSFSDLCSKDIISISTGRNIGRRDDIEFNEKTAIIDKLIIFGRPRLFGLLGRGKDIKINWTDIVTVGYDVILIKTPAEKGTSEHPGGQLEYD